MLSVEVNNELPHLQTVELNVPLLPPTSCQDGIVDAVQTISTSNGPEYCSDCFTFSDISDVDCVVSASAQYDVGVLLQPLN